MIARRLQLLLLVAVLAVGTAAVAPAGVAAQEGDLATLEGNGTAEDPYEIADVADLQAIDQDRDAHYVLVDDVDASAASEWNDGAGFDPIGGVDEAFTGTLDGDEHAIRGLRLERADQPVGLFAQIGAEGRVERLSLEDVSVDTGYEYNGAGLVARNHGELRHVSVTGVVSAGSPSGGIAGYNDGTIESSYAVLGGEGVTSTHAAVAGRNDGRIERVFGVVPEFDCPSSLGGGGCSGVPGLAIGNDTGTSEHVYEHAAENGEEYPHQIGLEYEDVTGTSAADTMAALDFEDTWEVTAGFPVFQWEYEGPELPAVGTEAEPFEIRTAGDLAEIQKNTSAHFVLATNVDASETADWNGGSGFEPLGSTADPFDGSFDGRNYVLSNLTIDRPDENEVGFVGALGAGTVSNVSLLDVDVTGATATGALVGTNNHGTVQQSGATGSVDGDSGVGGLVGQNGGVVEQSFSTASVSGSGQAGGLVGTNAGGMLSHAFAAGPVESDRTGAAGGLVGEQIGGTIEATYWDAEASGLNESAGSAVPLTTDEMTGGAARSSMDELEFATPPNFEGVWIPTDDYPVLSSEHTSTGGLEGSGTADDPYRIEDVQDLSSIRTDRDAHYELVDDVDASTTSEWNEGAGFEPIGEPLAQPRIDSDLSETFTGTLDGNGHAIAGLTVDRPDEKSVGLFTGVDDGAVVRNLTLEDVTVRGNRAIGAAAGVSDGTIASVDVTGRLEATPQEGSFAGQTGGLVGINVGSVTAASANVTVTGASEVGGLVGLNAHRLETVQASGEVAADGDGSDVGGLVGENGGSGVIENATGRALVTEGSTGDSALGGLVGSNGGWILESAAHGDVVAGDSFRVGGLIGDNSRGSVEVAYARGNVTGSASVGGLIGSDRADYSVGTLYATGTVSGDRDAGGLIGHTDGDGAESAYWDVNATGQADSSGTATGLTTEQLTGEDAPEHATSFDFGTVWTTTDGYPELVRQDASVDGSGLGNDSTLAPDCPTVARIAGAVVCDVDGDGNFRDVTGDGSVTNSDVTFFFSVQHVAPFDDRPDLFDFDGDDEVGQSDVIALFEYVAG